MGCAGWRLGGFGSAFFALAALAQPVVADPIYHLGPGAEYSPGAGVGTFTIPAVAEGIVFYLDPSDPPTEITLTRLFNTSGEKVWCIAVTRSTFACSAEGELQGNFGGNQDSGDPNGDGPITHLVNGLADDPVSLFQTASSGNDVVNGLGDHPVSLFQTASTGSDLPAGPASVPEPGSLFLLASALISFGIAGRRRTRSN